MIFDVAPFGRFGRAPTSKRCQQYFHRQYCHQHLCSLSELRFEVILGSNTSDLQGLLLYLSQSTENPPIYCEVQIKNKYSLNLVQNWRMSEWLWMLAQHKFYFPFYFVVVRDSKIKNWKCQLICPGLQLRDTHPTQSSII